MRPANFDYQRPTSLSEAIQLLANNDEAKALAGGHSLIPAMNQRLSTPEQLVDIGRLDELKGISTNNGTLSIGALSTHAQIAASSDVRTHCAALATATGLVGDPQVRNWGTLGGNLAHADPASDPPTVVLAAGGTLHLQGPNGTRSVSADNFFIDLFTTDLQPGELITRIEIPSLQGKKNAYVKLAHPASRYAIVGVCVVLEMNGNECVSARVAVGGATPKATRSPSAEERLTGSSLQVAAVDAAAEALVNDIAGDVMGDLFAPEDYRRAMAGVYLKRAVQAAMA
ncbi:MAG: xanthine dehydrogenase family protein subunit M [Chloroflexi bacterium]|nr:MAG: carbon monoxide dehydrogenase [Phototrophicales bacterium]RMF79719.1 MAG: xanthine dehydrogenase family protein subunit M [Chloroflexota bacterium]